MRRKKRIYGALKQLVALILCAIVLVPFAIIVVNSLKTSAEAKLMRLTWPSSGVQWGNFAKVIDRGNLISAFFNSALYAISGTALAVFLGAAAAFVLARRKSRLTDTIYFYLVMGIVLPVNMAALMQVMSTLGLMNSRLGIILLYTAINLPMSLFVIHGFVGTIPRELDEAALIDGAHPLQALHQRHPAAPAAGSGDGGAPRVHGHLERLPVPAVRAGHHPVLADDPGHLQLLRNVRERLELHLRRHSSDLRAGIFAVPRRAEADHLRPDQRRGERISYVEANRFKQHLRSL